MRITKYIIIVLLIIFGFMQLGASPITAMKKLNQIIRLAQNYYFEDFNMEKAMEGAIRGFLEELDPHSEYFDAEQTMRYAIKKNGEEATLEEFIELQESRTVQPKDFLSLDFGGSSDQF